MWEKRQSEISQGVAWEKREQGIYLIGYSGEDEELILPDEIEGEPVTGIGAYALMARKTLGSASTGPGVISVRGDGLIS